MSSNVLICGAEYWNNSYILLIVNYNLNLHWGLITTSGARETFANGEVVLSDCAAKLTQLSIVELLTNFNEILNRIFRN